MIVSETFKGDTHTITATVNHDDVAAALDEAEFEVWYSAIKPSVRFLLLAKMAMMRNCPSTPAPTCAHGLPPFLCSECGPRDA